MRRVLLLCRVVAFFGAACADEPAVEEVADEPPPYDVADQPADAAALFVGPTDGQTVTAPVAVEMDAVGVEIVPADATACRATRVRRSARGNILHCRPV
jgi:hypothetical protein